MRERRVGEREGQKKNGDAEKCQKWKRKREREKRRVYRDKRKMKR